MTLALFSSFSSICQMISTFHLAPNFVSTIPRSIRSAHTAMCTPLRSRGPIGPRVSAHPHGHQATLTFFFFLHLRHRDKRRHRGHRCRWSDRGFRKVAGVGTRARDRWADRQLEGAYFSRARAAENGPRTRRRECIFACAPELPARSSRCQSRATPPALSGLTRPSFSFCAARPGLRPASERSAAGVLGIFMGPTFRDAESRSSRIADTSLRLSSFFHLP